MTEAAAATLTEDDWEILALDCLGVEHHAGPADRAGQGRAGKLGRTAHPAPVPGGAPAAQPNQVTIIQGDYKRRFDVVLYCNGLPMSIIELKKADSAHANLPAAHAQLQTYLREFPLAFRFCVMTLATDGIQTKYGTPFTPLNHFSPWNVDDGVPVPPGAMLDRDAITALDTAIDGLYNQDRFLQLTTAFTAFDGSSEGLTKRIAKPHQYFAVTKAVGSTVHAVESKGKAGVVWTSIAGF